MTTRSCSSTTRSGSSRWPAASSTGRLPPSRRPSGCRRCSSTSTRSAANAKPHRADARLDGRVFKARLALAALASEAHDFMGVRIAEAAVHLVAGSPERAVAALGRRSSVANIRSRRTGRRSTRRCSLRWLREQLGDRHAAEASSERALDLAEPEGVVLPLVGRGPAAQPGPGSQTPDRARRLLSEILDVLAGSPVPVRGVAAPPHEELSEAELRVARYLSSSLQRTEIAAECSSRHTRCGRYLRRICATLDARAAAPRLWPAPASSACWPPLTRALTARRQITHGA